jgi:hypothetical protein
MTTPPSAKALTTLEWVSLTSSAIRAAGHDPADRIHYTGHRANIRRAYLPTIGSWGLLNTEDFINPAHPHLGQVLRVRYGAFRQFRYSRALMTRDEFELYHGDIEEKPWLHAELCWAAHDRVQAAFIEVNGTPCSLGLAAHHAAAEGARLGAKPECRLGLLPVEIVLWARLFEMLRMQNGLTYHDWEAFDDETKASFWKYGISTRSGATFPLGISHVAGAAPWRDLPTYRPLAVAG